MYLREGARPRAACTCTRSTSAWRKEVRSRMRWNERVDARAARRSASACSRSPCSTCASGTDRPATNCSSAWWTRTAAIVLPIEFLPAAERLGLIHDIDRWMTQQAVGPARATIPGLRLDVNLSGRAFDDARPAARSSSGRSPSAGCTPGSPRLRDHRDGGHRRHIARAGVHRHGSRSSGCRFSLDDFGSGLLVVLLPQAPADRLPQDRRQLRPRADATATRTAPRPGDGGAVRGGWASRWPRSTWRTRETLEVLAGLGRGLRAGVPHRRGRGRSRRRWVQRRSPRCDVSDRRRATDGTSRRDVALRSLSNPARRAARPRRVLGGPRTLTNTRRVGRLLPLWH